MDRTNPLAAAYPVRILVSDSNPGFRVKTLQILIEFGYQPDEAVSEEAFFSLVKSGSYDVILMNVRISGNEDHEKSSGIGQPCRPLLVGISPWAKLHFDFSADSVDSDILISRPTTREELIDQLKSCSVLACKNISY